MDYIASCGSNLAAEDGRKNAQTSSGFYIIFLIADTKPEKREAAAMLYKEEPLLKTCYHF